VTVGATLEIANSYVGGYNGYYSIQTVDTATKTVTITATQELQSTAITGYDLSRMQISSPTTDEPAEVVLLWTYNYKPDVMLFNDHMVFPWLQEYSYSFAKRILGEARSKFSTIAGPQGGTTLNGTALLAEAKEEMDKLEEDLKRYVDGSMPLTWVIG
jgi:hypothetical protein